MNLIYQLALNEEAETLALGRLFAQHADAPLTIHLVGDLGGGKTTFSRGFIQARGHEGKVKSPTYTLVEPYLLQGESIYHFDLYRLVDPEELYFMGIEEYFDKPAIALIEWPDRAGAILPAPDFKLIFDYNNEGRNVGIYARGDLNPETILLSLNQLKK